MYRSSAIIVATILVLISTSINGAPIQDQEIQRSEIPIGITRKCLRETKVTVMSIMLADTNNGQSNDVNYKQFIRCVYIAVGYMDPYSAQINTNKIRDVGLLTNSKETVDAILRGCDNLTTDILEAAYEYSNCVRANTRKFENMV